ncbi:uncharacterized protein TNCV_4533211 [Trichonephila clavipes]|nr:uncharacterized protein TNCV_4533211 [Trichonephila clavipes]
MFANVKGFKKGDLLLIAEEIGEVIPAKVTISDLKNLILNSDEYKKDSDFVTSVEDRKQREEVRKEEIDHKEKERQRQYELELARIQAQSNVVEEIAESFPPMSANNAKAVESLKAHFGRNELLVEVYVQELLKLVISVHKNEKFSMTSLYDKLESHTRALETLGV